MVDVCLFQPRRRDRDGREAIGGVAELQIQIRVDGGSGGGRVGGRSERLDAAVAGARGGGGRENGWAGEIGLGLKAAEMDGGGIVGTRRRLCGVEGAEPHAALALGVTDLRRVPPPWPFPHAPESRFCPLSSTSLAHLAESLHHQGLLRRRSG